MSLIFQTSDALISDIIDALESTMASLKLLGRKGAELSKFLEMVSTEIDVSSDCKITFPASATSSFEVQAAKLLYSLVSYINQRFSSSILKG